MSVINIAIIGGGLGGTILMNALSKYGNISANIYEAKATFKERGASVGLAQNAQRALNLLGLGHVLKDAEAVNVDGARCIMGEGPDAGKTVLEVPGKLATVHRAALLHELVRTIPEDRMHVNKKVVSIQNKTISFDDGTKITADVIIGADGIHSAVRGYVLPEDDSGIDPVHAGIWDCRGVVPFEKALAKLGPDILTPESPRQTIYSGNGVLLFHDTIDDGKSIAFLGAGTIPSEWDRSQWKQTIQRDWFSRKVEKWPGFAQGIIELLYGDQHEIPAFIEWESGRASTLYNDCICIMGDAAHATTPWQGAGLGQAIEDALILTTVLSECKSVDNVPAAFDIYDQIVRPRGRRVIESSREMAKLLLGARGLDAEEVGAAMKPMWDFIYQWDTEAVVRDAAEWVRRLPSTS